MDPCSSHENVYKLLTNVTNWLEWQKEHDSSQILYLKQLHDQADHKERSILHQIVVTNIFKQK